MGEWNLVLSGSGAGHDGGVRIASVSILDRAVYATAEAARHLGLRPERARAWLDGYQRAGKRYAPVIREATTGDDVVTWGEFVELGYLREYRRQGVPLQRLRPVIDELRGDLQTPYPLATAQPYVLGRELVLAAQERNELPGPIAIVIRSGQEVLLAEPASRFYRKAEFTVADEGDVQRLRPAGPVSPVVIDPLVGFGRPTVDSVATERLWELYDAGEDVEEIAEGYELPVDRVRSAVAYEEQLRSLAG